MKTSYRYGIVIGCSFFLFLIFFSGCSVKRMIWSDEFEYTGLPNKVNWSYDVGDRCPELCGWGNNELQYYTFENERNARVENGKLVIEARKETFKGHDFTSARLVTKNKLDIKYGRFEINAKLPFGKGTWPAIWMLPTVEDAFIWPDMGEIDIMEHVGYNHGTIYGTIHSKAYNHLIGTQKIDSIKFDDIHTTFHTYAIEGRPNRIDWFVDNHNYHTIYRNGGRKEEWPFDQPFHLILNIAVGGNWGGKYGVADDIWPQRMEVDFVRVYTLNN